MIRKGLVLIFFLLSACTPGFGKNYANEQAELAQNQARWKRQNIPHYRFQLAPPDNATPMIVEVKDGSLVSVVDIKGITHAVNAGNAILQHYANFLTIPDLFTYINKTYSGKPESMKVVYDPVLGYPTTINVSQFAEPCCQGITITVSNFHVLSP